MSGREYAVVTHQVLELAARSGCAADDCEFVALAQDLGVTLVTADRRVLAGFPAVARAPEAYAGRAGR
jgi:predicted nucleic acid-binding protein